MQENTLKALISKRLNEISILKGVVLTEQHYRVWSDKILADYKSGLLSNPEFGFKKLESEKSYGGLDYAVFFEGAKTIVEDDAEKAWSEVLISCKYGGNKPISARAGKALNSLGGLSWLKDSKPSNVDWDRKTFIDIYKNTPDPKDANFHCPGLIAKMYFNLKGDSNVPLLQ